MRAASQKYVHPSVERFAASSGASLGIADFVEELVEVEEFEVGTTTTVVEGRVVVVADDDDEGEEEVDAGAAAAGRAAIAEYENGFLSAMV